MSMVKSIIRRLRNEGIYISRKMEQYILHGYLEESFPYGWTDESEAYHEIRDVVRAYENTGSHEFLCGKYDRLIETVDELRNMYADLLHEYLLMEERVPKEYDEGPVCGCF